MTAVALLDRLDKVRPTGAGTWVARCPAHDDRGPSLSVRELDDGRIELRYAKPDDEAKSLVTRVNGEILGQATSFAAEEDAVRLGAPGRVRIAPRLVTMAASSTKVESGNVGSGGSLTSESPSRSSDRQ